MSNLVERLRATNKKVRHSQELRDEAADEIERLQRRLAEVASYENCAQRKEIESLFIEGESKDDKIDVLRVALEEAMEWNWGEEGMPENVIAQCEQALELVLEGHTKR